IHRGGVGAALLECHILRRSRIRDGFQIAQCLLRVGDRGFCVLRHRVPTQVREADCDDSKFLDHSDSSFTTKQNSHAATYSLSWKGSSIPGLSPLAAADGFDSLTTAGT